MAAGRSCREPEPCWWLARYLARPLLSPECLRLEPGLACYRHKRARARRGEPFDPGELLARLLIHIPAPRLHLVRYYSHYAHVPRARRRRSLDETQSRGEAPRAPPGRELEPKALAS